MFAARLRGATSSLLLAGTGAALGAVALGASYVFGAGGADADSAAPAADSKLLAAMEKRLAALELQAAAGKNMALVFIKPHACNPKVVELVRAKLALAGIKVTSEGSLGSEQIDKEMLIDNHYGAIAAKAVKLKPAQLSVPPKGKAAFQKLFGLSWEDALAKGLVYNASDALGKIGGDGFELDRRWGKLSRDTDLLKFGGGFYVGKVGDIFVINGFYAAMRAAYARAAPPLSRPARAPARAARALTGSCARAFPTGRTGTPPRPRTSTTSPSSGPRPRSRGRRSARTCSAPPTRPTRPRARCAARSSSSGRGSG